LEEAMKKMLLAIILICPVLAWAAPKPSEYTVAVHVTGSHLVYEAGGKQLHLDVVIDGKKLELVGGHSDYLLRLGDYKAKAVEDVAKDTGEYRRQYEFLLADGTKRMFWLIGEQV
jgi:hypothetical protein